MSIKIDGVAHNTIKDAAEHLKVKTKTIKRWIVKGIIPEPSEVPYGKGAIKVFDEAYLKEAEKSSKAYWKKKRKERKEQR